MNHRIALTALIALPLGCKTAEEGDTEPTVEEGLELLSPREQLIRLSVDLRGVHPTEAELESVDPDYGGNPELYEEYVDYWLEDPRFVERIMEIYNLRILTRTGNAFFDDFSEVGLGAVPNEVIGDRLGEEPLRLFGHIVENDLPFREIVLADYTMADPVVAAAWRLDREEPNSNGWSKAWYTDGRPHAGILTMNTIWQRYPSMGGNANRARANAMSIMLLCDDYLQRPIVLNRAAVDQLTIDPEDAISTTGCQSCHSTLDPLAAHFFGFFRYDDDESVVEATTYLPENEMAWMDYSGKAPGYYGRPTGNIREMVELLAQDDRLAQCAVKSIFEGLTQRTVLDEDWGELNEHKAVFDETDQNVRELVRSIVKSDEYKASAVTDTERMESIATVKLVSPGQLAGIIEQKTGYRWTFGGRDGLTTHDLGLPVLAGGIDSQFVKVPSYNPSVGLMFIQERLAQGAGYSIAENDLVLREAGAEAMLLRYINVGDTPEANADKFEAQVRYMYLHLTGIPLPEDAEEPALLMELWKQVYSAEGSEVHAWAAVISGVLRDPRIIFY